MRNVGGLIFAAIVVLGTVWLYNHFSDGGIASLGKK